MESVDGQKGQSDVIDDTKHKKSNYGGRNRKRNRQIKNRGDDESKIELSDLDLFHRLAGDKSVDFDLLKIDVEHICNSLGYCPLNLYDIGAKNAKGNPVIAVLYPLNRNEEVKGRYCKEYLPFPTMMWMTCPDLKKSISRLEDQGLIDEFQKRLDESEEARGKMKNAHELYAAERWGILSDEDRDLVVQMPKWEVALRVNGIAGMRDFTRVKCLHCHYAHFLARPTAGNVLGEWTHEALQLAEESASKTTESRSKKVLINE
jgi:uncharacterized protein